MSRNTSWEGDRWSPGVRTMEIRQITKINLERNLGRQWFSLSLRWWMYDVHDALGFVWRGDRLRVERAQFLFILDGICHRHYKFTLGPEIVQLGKTGVSEKIRLGSRTLGKTECGNNIIEVVRTKTTICTQTPCRRLGSNNRVNLVHPSWECQSEQT